jgi:N-acetylglutamate synthase-like GNAT family acetyltransferase
MGFSFSLRPATEADFAEIKALIRQVRINPMGLDWRRFTVAVEGLRPEAARPGHFKSTYVGIHGRAGVEGRLAEPDGPEIESHANIIACGQLKPVPGGLTELASLAVLPAFRRRGIARALIEHLLAEATPPVYLTCRSRLGSMYEKFGFRALDGAETPAYYRRLQRLAGLLMELARRNETLLVMKLG